MKKKSNWDYYGVKIIKQIMVEGEPDPTLINEFYADDGKQLFEESIIIMRAQSSEHACNLAEKKAIALGKPYPNAYGQQVIWKFIKTVDCSLIFGKLASGAEVYSCFHSTNDTADEFINKWFCRADDERKK